MDLPRPLSMPRRRSFRRGKYLGSLSFPLQCAKVNLSRLRELLQKATRSCRGARHPLHPGSSQQRFPRAMENAPISKTEFNGDQPTANPHQGGVGRTHTGKAAGLSQARERWGV